MPKPVLPMPEKVCLIRRWSGVKVDETPLCGSDNYHRTEVDPSGAYRDSADVPMKICGDCSGRNVAATVDLPELYCALCHSHSCRHN